MLTMFVVIFIKDVYTVHCQITHDYISVLKCLESTIVTDVITMCI